MAHTRRGYARSPSDHGGSTSEDDDDGGGGDGRGEEAGDRQAQLSLRDKEAALVESALARIRRAQAKGKSEVKLNQEELSALERRRERMQEEERRKRRDREPRFAVPISQFEPTSRKKRLSAGAGGGALESSSRPRPEMPGSFHEPGEQQQQQVFPPIGYFPPPNTSRPRSGTSSGSQRPPTRDGSGESPFRYSYVHNAPPPSSRHGSDTASRPRSSSHRPLPHEEDWSRHPKAASASDPALNPVDPFQFMTGGVRAPYHSGAAPTRRPASGPPSGEAPYGAAPAAARGSHGSRRVSRGGLSSETTEDEEGEGEADSTSDERGHGARVQRHGSGGRGREEIVVVEPEMSPEPEPAEPEPEPPRQRVRKSSSAASPAKRKPVGSGRDSTRRRKGR